MMKIKENRRRGDWECLEDDGSVLWTESSQVRAQTRYRMENPDEFVVLAQRQDGWWEVRDPESGLKYSDYPTQDLALRRREEILECWEENRGSQFDEDRNWLK